MFKELKIFLASPRGFCAGVDRAIEIVEKALKKFGSPVKISCKTKRIMIVIV